MRKPCGPNALGTLQHLVLFPPQRTGPQRRLPSILQRRQARIDPGAVGLNVCHQALVRPREAVLCGGPQDDPWLAAPSKGAQLLCLGVRQRAGRRAHHVGTMR